jgi:DNA-binding transcriptional LysR family regulator
VELRHVQAFLAVAEEGSVTAAARRLYIAQPALSRTIRALEHHVGASLFVRHLDGMRLTDAGHQLLPLAWELISRAEEIGRVLVDGERAAERVGAPTAIRLASYVYDTSYAYGSILRLWQDAQPQVHLLQRPVWPSDGLMGLIRGEYDALIAPDVPGIHDDRLTRVPLWDEPMVVGSSRNHRFASMSEVTVGDVLEEEFFPRAPGGPSAMDDYFTFASARNGESVRPRGEHRFTGIPEVADYVAAHDVVAVGPELAGSPAVVGRKDYVRRRVIDAPAMTMAVFSRRDLTSPSLTTLTDVLRAVGQHVVPHLLALQQLSRRPLG